MILNKLCNFKSLYRSPSQSSDEFENFVYNLDLTLEALTQKNPFLTVIIGDFNAKFNKWCSTNKTTPEGAKIDNLTSLLKEQTQLLKERNHISDNYRSCIDLIFTSQSNLVVDFGIHPSLYENCHHQIVYSRFNLEIFYHLHTCFDFFKKLLPTTNSSSVSTSFSSCIILRSPLYLLLLINIVYTSCLTSCRTT